MKVFSLHSTWDSKWLKGSERIAMGIRYKWQNSQGSILGVDICQFDSDSVASKAREIQGRIAYSSVFKLENLDSLKSILVQWQNWWHSDFSKKFFSVVGVKGKLAVLVYQFDPAGIDVNRFYSIVEKLSKQYANL